MTNGGIVGSGCSVAFIQDVASLSEQVYRPSNDAYVNEVSDTIERVVNLKKNEYVGNVCGPDDLAQEIRVKLIYSSNFLDRSRKPFSYLVKCADNHISDLRKGIYQSNNPPCRECSRGGSCSADGGKCNAWLKYEATLHTKQRIDSPRHLGDTEIVQYNTVWGHIMAQELNERIIAVLPNYLLKSYHDLINGGDVPTVHRNKIREIVRGLLDAENDAGDT